MKIQFCFTTLFAAAALSLTVAAQAPAGVPAGSNGICKDGTYSTAAQKSGACQGHKGVQTWYSASAANPVKPTGAAATPAPMPAAVPAPAPRPLPPATQAMAPAPRPAPAAPATAPQAAPAARKGSLSRETAAAGGGPGMVWVNTASKVYHCSGTAYYGKTKAGKYVSEDAAKAEGDRANGGKPCTK